MATTSLQSLPPAPPPPYVYPSVIIILISVLLVLFFFGFFTTYFCRSIVCHRQRATALPAATGQAQGGLDPLLVQSFPTFAYSTVAEDFWREKYGLECAICLSDFHGEDVLRLLAACHHVFHRECVDQWFGSHRTCPVCRRTLDSPTARDPPVKSPIIILGPREDVEEGQAGPTSHIIVIKEGNEQESGDHLARSGGGVEKHGRSHSTGHRSGRDRNA